MSELHILNVGRADCAVFLLDTPGGTRTVVVDGGEKYHEGRRPLLDFLTPRRITPIDLLILPHLHQDHLGGFLHLNVPLLLLEIYSSLTAYIRCSVIKNTIGNTIIFSSI